ncbi:WD repeat-containing protein [Microthyrium microscopicum]|uniref:DNA damage-binding protein CMR1 n=1 Tax=Microthyrium microscopicum TaxID=703497 RepID=A0A6A6TZ89_9PEZI|nr:WD repeat-containing protein [Microthyrium microscopicum]
MPSKPPPVSEYERKRLETIAKNKALLRNLALDAAATGLAPTKTRAKPTTRNTKTKRKAAPKVKEEAPAPRRVSMRLRGVVADSEVAKRKAEEDVEERRQFEQAKRRRVTGDLKVEDILTNGQSWDGTGNFLRGVQPAKPYERTFDAEAGKKHSDKEVKALIERLSGLELWKDVSPADIKVTPERVYSLTFHPTAEKALVFAGDKLGSLGIFDGSQEIEDPDDWEPQITTMKLHSRTISALHCVPADPKSLYSASYDSTIRRLDIEKGVAVEVYAPTDTTAEEGVSQIQISGSNPSIVYFTTLQGRFGIHDTRTPAKKTPPTELYQLSEKKIGGFSVSLPNPDLMATASLDRTLRLWDLRKLVGKGSERTPYFMGEHENRLSVSSAMFNYAGQVTTASYDDTVKIYDFGSILSSASIGTDLTPEQMEPSAVIPHNNQTGRWVTMQPQWQLNPQDNIQRLCIGSMNRFVDIYSSTGVQLAQLGGDGISAVPAVAQFHPSMDWVGAATASGKLCLWM